MKYIIDIDALKDCLDLIRVPTILNGRKLVYLDDVKEMMDKFPKEEYRTIYKERLGAMREPSVSYNNR